MFLPRKRKIKRVREVLLKLTKAAGKNYSPADFFVFGRRELFRQKRLSGSPAFFIPFHSSSREEFWLQQTEYFL